MSKHSIGWRKAKVNKQVKFLTSQYVGTCKSAYTKGYALNWVLTWVLTVFKED